MRVMMLLKSDQKSEAGIAPDQKMMTDMGKYIEQMFEAGVFIGGEGLHPTTHGTRVRISKGKTTIIDGPFAETKEVVAGYFLMKTKDLKEATDWALKIPGEPEGGEGELELRPLYETEDFPIDPAEQAGGWRDQEIEARQAPKEPGPEKGARYIFFLKADANTESKMMPSEKLLQEMGALIGEMTDKGVLIAGEGLKPTSEGVKVRVSGGKRTVIDGPFTETKEIVAGFTLYRAQTKEEAIEWARRTLRIHMDGTGIDSGEVEVRRIQETEEIPVSAQEKPGGWRDQDRALRERIGQ